MLKNRHIFYSLFFVFFLATCLIVVANPNKFQKWNSIKSINLSQNSRTLPNEQELAVEEFIGNIPYKKRSDYVYTVYPIKKYERTVLQGYGDCSTMSFGAAYYLLQENISFELIHFLPVDTLFSGGGHVAMRLPYVYKDESKIGILDIAGGGLPVSKGNFIDIAQLQAKNFSADLHIINDKASKFYESYYKDDYLENIYFGFTPSDEIHRYFNFIEKIYFSLGHEKLEKLLYDGLSIFFGKYYSIYIDETFLDQFKAQYLFYNFLLQLMRLLTFTLIIIVFGEIFYFLKRRKNYITF